MTMMNAAGRGPTVRSRAVAGMPVRVDQCVYATGAGSSLTALSKASLFAASPPSIISAPFSRRMAITLQPTPWKSVRAPRSVAEIAARFAAPSHHHQRAAKLQKRRRDSRRQLVVCVCV